MRRCRKCGFSLPLSKIYQWNENGTITYHQAPDFRLVMYYSDLFDHLFSQIEEKLGFSVSRSIFEAQRAASRVAIEALLELAPSWVRNTYAFKHLANYLLCRLSIWIGTGYSRSLGYRSGDWGEAIVRNPYNRELMAAVILGAFESLDGCAYVHEWKKLGDNDVISITATKGKSAEPEWTSIVPEKIREGGRELPRCPKCGAPDALSSLVWHDKEGTIIDSRIGVRVNFLDAYANRAVFRELERELGDSVNPLVLETVKAFALPHLEKLPAASSRRERKAKPRPGRCFPRKPPLCSRPGGTACRSR